MSAASVTMAETVPTAELLTIKEAYRQVKNLCDPAVAYEIRFMDDDGQILRRFTRTTALEAWITAIPLDEDGHPVRHSNRIVCPIALGPEASKTDRYALEAVLKEQLAALTEDSGA